MDFNKLTIKSQEAVAAAQELARRNSNPELYPEHLTLALLDQELPRELVPDAAARAPQGARSRCRRAARTGRGGARDEAAHPGCAAAAAGRHAVLARARCRVRR